MCSSGFSRGRCKVQHVDGDVVVVIAAVSRRDHLHLRSREAVIVGDTLQDGRAQRHAHVSHAVLAILLDHINDLQVAELAVKPV